METNNLEILMRSPEEGPSRGAGPAASGGSGHTTNGQWRGRLRDPRREQTGNVPRPETASVTTPVASTSSARIRSGSHRGRNTPPAQRVLPTTQSATTRAGLPRQRMAWSQELNECVVRCFYLATNGGTELIGYRPKMLRSFLGYYPEYSHLSEQRLADQRNAIFRRDLVNEVRRIAIKSQVERENLVLSMPNEAGAENGPENSSEVQPVRQEERDRPPQDDLNISSASCDIRTRINNEFERAFTEFEGTDLQCRPLLPRTRHSKCLLTIMKELDNLVANKLQGTPSYAQVLSTIYCAAVAVTRYFGLRLISRTEPKKSPNTPPWKKRLDARIEIKRADIARLKQWVSGNHSKRLKSKVKAIMEKYREHTPHDELNHRAEECLDTIMQKLHVLVNRRSRYWTAYCRKRDNGLFARSEKTFYKKLNNANNVSEEVTPNSDEIVKYWSAVWSHKEEFEHDAYWLRIIERGADNIVRMTDTEVTTGEIDSILSSTPNWNTPGIDGIYAFYFKRLHSVHGHLARLFNSFLVSPNDMPSTLTTGKTYFLPKGKQDGDPQNYRPITCLPVMYKIFTAVLAQKISRHCTEQKVIADQQKGCTELSVGCKEQLTIDAIVSGQASKNHRNLYSAYIDYKKAFDTVPHSWLLWIAETYKISPRILGWLKVSMAGWQTEVVSQHPETHQKNIIKIQRGIFQGDPLSPILFCLAINPLSFLLDKSGYGFPIRLRNSSAYNISHLLYMDDLKLFAATQTQLQQMLDITADFTNCIKMRFGVEKCRTQAVIGGVQSVVGFSLGPESLAPMNPNETYKYLGFHQAKGTLHKQAKEELTQKFLSRVKQVLKTKLKSKFITRAINSYAIPILTYSFGIINWSATELEEFDRRLRVAFTLSGMHHPKSAVERFTLLRTLGGRGVKGIKCLHDEHVRSLRNYFLGKAQTSNLLSAVCGADKKFSPLDLAHHSLEQTATNHYNDVLLEKWRGKSLHGRYPSEVNADHVDKIATFRWLQEGYLFPETEGFLVAIQDQVIATRNYRKFIINDREVTSDTCRHCHEASETIQHITGACRILAAVEYKERHDAVGRLIHGAIVNTYGIGQVNSRYYTYRPENIVENARYRLYWDRSILTDHGLQHNRPDITLIDKESKSAYLIDISIPNSHNIQNSYNEKIRKYRDLGLEMKRLLGLEMVKIIPLILSSTGVIPKHLLEGLENLQLKKELFIEMQKATILATCRIVRRFLEMDQQ